MTPHSSSVGSTNDFGTRGCFPKYGFQADDSRYASAGRRSLVQPLHDARPNGRLDDTRTGIVDIDRLEHGAFICDRGGQVMIANAIAQGLLGDLIGSGRRIRFAQDSDDRAFAGLLKAALSTSLAGESSTMAFELAASRTSIVLRAMKLRHDAGPRSRGDVLVLVEEQRDEPSEALRRGYGLTATEARIAIDLSEGLGPEEISAKQGVTLATVRSHLKSIFRKTDTRGQVQLVVLVFKLSRSG